MINPDYNMTKQFCVEHTDGLVQERRNSSALAMELRLSCINPSIYAMTQDLNCYEIVW